MTIFLNAFCWSNVRKMGFRSSKKIYTEEDLYTYAIGALGRRMRSTAELKRLLRQRVEADTEYGQTLVELIIRRLKDSGYLNDARYARPIHLSVATTKNSGAGG